MALLEVKHIGIEFPGVRALADVSITFPDGRMTALCGENGAGKSTLGKIIAGVYPNGRFSGQVFLDGEELSFTSALDAEKQGVVLIHQELNLINDMCVAENIFLSQLPSRRGIVDRKGMHRQARELLDSLELQDIDTTALIRDLTVSRRQMVEIAKALSKNPKVLIFDEATSSLSEAEIRLLFDVINRLKQRNVTMIFVTHKLDEIFRVCEYAAVLKDGRFVWERPISEVTQHDIVTGMVGRELSEMFPPKGGGPRGEELLAVKNWTVYDRSATGKPVVENAEFQLYSGEILGIYGIVGAGRTELMASIFEGKAVKSTGELYIRGQRKTLRDTRSATTEKLAFVTEDRKKTGLILEHSVRNNIALASLGKRSKFGKLDHKAEASAVSRTIQDFRIKVPDTGFLVRQLSGGNQQKVVLGKWMLNDPDILIMDEPTRGIDVGAKAEIYKMLRDFTREGKGVIVISGELPEILGLSDRILVMCEGRIAAEFSCDEANEVILAQYALHAVDGGSP